MSTPNRFRRALGDMRRSIGWWTSSEVAKLVKLEYDNARLGQKASVLGYMDFTYMEDKIVAQPWNYAGLKTYALYHPFLNIIHSTITREVNKRKLVPAAKFAVKCEKCGREYQRPIKKCINKVNDVKCGSENLREPSYDEKVFLLAFLKDPNRQNEMKQINETIMRDCLSTGNAYISKSILMPGTKTIELWNEPSEYMWIVCDDKGILGSDVYFCQKCHSQANDSGTTYNQEQYDKFGGMCPVCGTPLEETAFVFKRDDKVARFAKREIIHFNSDPWLPFPYGIPKVISCLLELRSATAMSKFNFDNYSLVRMAKIIVHKGHNQAEANAIADAIESQEQMLNDKAISEGYVRKIQRILHLGARQGVDVLDAMPDPQKMQSLEWYDHWLVRIVAPIYGVQPVYINTGSGGAGGYFQRMEIQVNNDAVEKWRDLIASGFTENLLPDLAIRDYRLEFEPLEPADPKLQAQISQQQLAVLETAARLGVPASIDDEGQLFVSGEVDMEHFKEMLQLGQTNMFGQKPGVTTHIDNVDEGPTKPRQPGDTGSITSGGDQGRRKKQ